MFVSLLFHDWLPAMFLQINERVGNLALHHTFTIWGSLTSQKEAEDEQKGRVSLGCMGTPWSYRRDTLII